MTTTEHGGESVGKRCLMSVFGEMEGELVIYWKFCYFWSGRGGEYAIGPVFGSMQGWGEFGSGPGFLVGAGESLTIGPRVFLGPEPFVHVRVC